MTEYFKVIEKARNTTEIREIIHYIRKKYRLPLASIIDLLDSYEGKSRQVGQRFKTLKKAIIKELQRMFGKLNPL